MALNQLFIIKYLQVAGNKDFLIRFLSHSRSRSSLPYTSRRENRDYPVYHASILLHYLILKYKITRQI